MNDFKNETPWLHLYAQDMWHGDADIVGTRKGLVALRDAVDQALAKDDGRSQVEQFVNDGEGYCLNIHILNFEDMQQMANPYTDESAQDHRLNVLWPDHLRSVTKGEG